MAEEHEPVVVLASASPRRRKLLRYLGINFESVATTAEEQENETPAAIMQLLPPFPLDVRQHPALLAWHKADAAAGEGCRGVILGADTIVVIDGDILGKPRDEA